MASVARESPPYFLFTIGHSTRPIDEFIALLDENAVSLLVDVRTVPKSRANPQYWNTALRSSLRKAGIAYRHLPDLGGLRKPRKDSVNTGWRNRSFQGYADYMETEEFKRALEDLVALARKKRVAIMCAEAVPWRCHRNLIADALTVRGFAVGHIMARGKVSPHRVTAWARVRGKKIVYAISKYPPATRRAEPRAATRSHTGS